MFRSFNQPRQYLMKMAGTFKDPVRLCLIFKMANMEDLGFETQENLIQTVLITVYHATVRE